jgi:hypothetical protein
MKNALQLVWMALVGLLLVWTTAHAQARTVAIPYTPEPGSLLLAGMVLIAIGVAMKKTQRKA